VLTPPTSSTTPSDEKRPRPAGGSRRADQRRCRQAQASRSADATRGTGEENPGETHTYEQQHAQPFILHAAQGQETSDISATLQEQRAPIHAGRPLTVGSFRTPRCKPRSGAKPRGRGADEERAA